MSGYSLERSDRDGIRLLPFERDLFDTPPSPPDVPAHPVVPLESFHLETIGQTSVEQVALASFYLGARSPSEERRQHIWRYRPEWTYFDRVTALQQMEARGSHSHRTLFLRPAILSVRGRPPRMPMGGFLHW